MVTPQTLSPDVSIRVVPVGEDRIFKVSNDQQEIGRLKLRRIEDDLWCPHNKAQQGYGPFLYDLAIEYSTIFGRGALPATGAATIYGKEYFNTQDSNVVWKYYYEKRTDVQHFVHPKASRTKEPWLFSVYKKQPVFITELQNMQRITFK